MVKNYTGKGEIMKIGIIEIIENENENEIKYPCVMKSETGKIVIFLKDGEGIVVNDQEVEFINTWNTKVFHKFNGKIIFKND